MDDKKVEELVLQPDGSYAPKGLEKKLPAVVYTKAKGRKVMQPRSKKVEEEVIEGFRLGMSIVRKVGKAFNVKV